MARRPAGRMSPAVTLGLIRVATERRAREQEAAPPANPIQPYEVRIRRSVGDSVFLVGHDRFGEPMVEVRMRKKLVTPGRVRRMERWCRENDDALKAI